MEWATRCPAVLYLARKSEPPCPRRQDAGQLRMSGRFARDPVVSPNARSFTIPHVCPYCTHQSHLVPTPRAPAHLLLVDNRNTLAVQWPSTSRYGGSGFFYNGRHQVGRYGRLRSVEQTPSVKMIANGFLEPGAERQSASGRMGKQLFQVPSELPSGDLLLKGVGDQWELPEDLSGRHSEGWPRRKTHVSSRLSSLRSIVALQPSWFNVVPASVPVCLFDSQSTILLITTL